MKKAIYVFSGDPITLGHTDIIKRAAKVFDHVVVGIGSNPDKKYMFSLEDRLDMAKQALYQFENVSVEAFSGLLVDFAFEKNIPVIIKGVRNTTDFEYESNLHAVGESQKLGIDTFVLFARPELAHVSSSAVKAIQKEHGFIQDYVPLNVKRRLEEVISNQVIIGITGEIAAGKSYTTEALVKTIQNKYKVGAHNIDLDVIGHQILGNLQEPRYIDTRDKLVEYFGKKIKGADGFINRKKLGAVVFNDQKALNELNKIMRDSILVRIKRELQGKEGVIFLNAALLIESGLMGLCNNNVILVRCSKEIQKQRLLKRGLKEKQIKRRLESQYSYEKKKEILQNEIEEHSYGNVWTLNTSMTNNKETETMAINFSNRFKWARL